MQLLGRWLTRCELALLYVGVFATFAMMCLTSADALSRYAFNRPILGAFEITEKYLMVAAIFMAPFERRLRPGKRAAATPALSETPMVEPELRVA